MKSTDFVMKHIANCICQTILEYWHIVYKILPDISRVWKDRWNWRRRRTCRWMQSQIVYWMNWLWLQNETNCTCSKTSGSFSSICTIFIRLTKTLLYAWSSV